MASISELPCEIKVNIFSRIRIRDLYEVSVVAQEWWWSSITTYQGILSEKEPLIKTLLNFYTRAMILPTPYLWLELVKHGIFSAVELNYIPRPIVLRNFLESRKPIRSLCLQTELGSLANQANLAIGSVKTRLDSTLKFFPHLETLKLQNFAVVPSSLKIPKGVKHVHLSGIQFNGVAWSSLFEHPDSIQSLELQVEGLTYDPCAFRNLRSLTLEFEEPLAVHQMKNILNLIRGHKVLRSVKLICATITKEWWNLFGKTIENVYLNAYISLQLLNELGTEGCCERRVMSYVCLDFTTLKQFTLFELSSESDEEHEDDFDAFDVDYVAVYTCKPQVMEEKLYLDSDTDLSPKVRTITRTETGPTLRDLHIKYEICPKEDSDEDSEDESEEEPLTNCVPAGVKKFKMELKGEFDNLSITRLCEQPENLEDLSLHSLGVKTSLSIQRQGFASCTQLKILEMAYVNLYGIQCVLQQCLSLQKLTLIRPLRSSLTCADIRVTSVGKTIRELNLIGSDANLEVVLYRFPNLEVLRLSSHLVCPLSIPTAIVKLKLFSAMFHAFSDIRRNNRNVAWVMNSIDVPCKVFLNLDNSSPTFKFGWNDSIVEDFDDLEEVKGYAYCHGLPKRYLEALGIKVFGDVRHFMQHKVLASAKKPGD